MNGTKSSTKKENLFFSASCMVHPSSFFSTLERKRKKWIVQKNSVKKDNLKKNRLLPNCQMIFCRYRESLIDSSTYLTVMLLIHNPINVTKIIEAYKYQNALTDDF